MDNILNTEETVAEGGTLKKKFNSFKGWLGSFWDKLSRKFVNFSKDKYYYYLAFGIPIAILIFTYICMEMSPFGEKSVLTLDMDGQYVYFFEQIRDVYTGKSSLFYTFERSLGGEFLGYFTYYLASPLSFLVVLFPASAITEAIMLMFLLKSGFAGLTFCIYLSKTRTKNIVGFTMFSVMYALCAYAIMYQFNTMWMDALIWLPLITLGIERLVKEGKFKLFIISLAIAVCSNYYIGYMLCIFVAIYFFAFIVSKSPDELNGLNETNHVFKSLVRIAIASVIALMMAAAIIFSAYYSLSLGKSSYQDNSFEATLRFDFMHLLGKMFLGAFDTVRLSGTPNVYSGLFPLIMLPAFYTSKKVTARERVVFTILILVFISSFSINTIDLMWHGFQMPIWFNYRYSFIFSFILLLMAYRGYESYDDLSVPFFGKTVAVIALLLIIVQKTVSFTRFEYIDGRWQSVETEPGLSIIWLSLLFVLLYLLLFYVRKRIDFAKATTVVLAVVVCAEALVNSIIYWDGELKDGGVSYRESYRDYVDGLTEVTEELKLYDPSFYRTEHVFNRKYNDNLVLDINGVSEFTSTFNASTVKFLERLGYYTSSPIVKYSTCNPVTDSLLGIKYVIGSTTKDSNGELEGKNSIYDGYDAVIAKNGYVIYENPYALPIAYRVDKNMQKSFDKSSFFEGNKSFALTSSGLFDSMLGYDSGIFDVCNYTINKGTLEKITVDDKGGKSFYSYDDGESAYFYFTVQAMRDGNIYMHLPSPYTTAAKLFINEKQIHTNYFQDENKSIMDLGSFKKGEYVTVRLEFTHYRLYLWDTKDYFVQINPEALEDAITTLKAGGLNVTEYSDTRIFGTMNAIEDGVAFTTIPYDANWQVYVDGERVEAYEAVDALLAFDISKGEHTVEMKYVHTPFLAGAIISVIGIDLLILLWLLEKRFGIRILPIRKRVFQEEFANVTETEEGDEAGESAEDKEGFVAPDEEPLNESSFTCSEIKEQAPRQDCSEENTNTEISEDNNDISS